MNPASTRPSMRKAINAMCKGCIFDPVAGGQWRQQVEACTSPECPLFELRPRSKARDSQKPSTRCECAQDGGMAGNGEALGGEP